MYPPSELLLQVEKQVKAEFKDQVTDFEWLYEEEYTSITVRIRKTAWQKHVICRTRQIIDAIIGDPYIVALMVRPIERVGEADDLFNLVYNGGSNVFFVNYYAPERPRSTPFSPPIYYTQFMKAIRTIRLDSPFELWKGLFPPAYRRLAKKKGVTSFCAKNLAEELRDFLLKHLDFIESIAEATGRPLQILYPLPQFAASVDDSSHSNGAQASQPELMIASSGPVAEVAREHQLALQT
ncbi:MAG: hypothetical protein ACPGWR_19375 [Ardenticatenaceae bacterium]